MNESLACVQRVVTRLRGHVTFRNDVTVNGDLELHASGTVTFNNSLVLNGGSLRIYGATHVYDRVKQAMRMETDRPGALREAIIACRNGGVVSVPGVYGGFIDKVPFGSIVNKALTIKSGQTHVHRYMRPLLERIENGEIDPSFIITHRIRLDEAPLGYEVFRNKEDECVKVVMKPGMDEPVAHVH